MEFRQNWEDSEALGRHEQEAPPTEAPTPEEQEKMIQEKIMSFYK